MVAGKDRIIVEDYVIGIIEGAHRQNLIRLPRHIACLLCCREIQRRIGNKHLILAVHTAQHIIGGAVRIDLASVLIDLDSLCDIVPLFQSLRHIVDRVIECLRVDGRPFGGNVLVFRNGLVEVKLFRILCNTPVFIRHIPAIQGVAGSEGTRDGAACEVTGVGGNFLLDVRIGAVDRAAIQMEGHRVGRCVPNRVEPQVALNGKHLSGLSLGLGVFAHGPLHIHAGRTKGPALEGPCGGAIFRPVGADSGLIGRSPAIRGIRIFVRIVQPEAILLLGYLRAVGQLHRAQGVLSLIYVLLIGGNRVGDGVPVSIVVEIEVVGGVLSTDRCSVISAIRICVLRAMVRSHICSGHMQPGAGILLCDRIGRHRVHLAGHSVIASIVSAYRVISAVGVIIGDLSVCVRHPHQIVKVVFGDGLVIRGHQIQEVLLIRGVIVVNTDTLQTGNIQIRHLITVVVPIVADISVKPVGDQVMPQVCVLRVRNNLSAHSGVGAHNSGFAGIVQTGIEESTFIVLAICGGP